MEYGKTYYKDYEIEGEDLDFSGDERLQFTSPSGYINNATFINFSLIEPCNSNQAIYSINEDGSVNCVNVSSDTVWSLTNSYYLYNSSGILKVNETRLNQTIDSRQGNATNLTNYALKNQSEHFFWKYYNSSFWFLRIFREFNFKNC
jgi:hypothetical protein